MKHDTDMKKNTRCKMIFYYLCRLKIFETCQTFLRN